MMGLERQNRYPDSESLWVLAAGCIVFGALFYAGLMAAALVLRLPVLFVIAVAGTGVTYLSYFVQGVTVTGFGGRPLQLAGIILVLLSIVVCSIGLAYIFVVAK